MAPAIKELSRWLDANSEYYVAPDWAEVVKHSVSYHHFIQRSYGAFPPSGTVRVGSVLFYLCLHC